MNVAANSALPAVEAPLLPAARGTQRRRTGFFLLFNGIVTLGILCAFAFNPDARAGLAAYVWLLGLLCSAPLLFMKSLQGRVTLLFIFQGIFFALFALADWVSLIAGFSDKGPHEAFLSGGELAILLTSLCFSVGYGLVAGVAPGDVRGLMSRDWSPRAIGIMGVVFWGCGFVLSLMFIGGNDFRHATTTGFAVFGGFAGVAVLFTYLLPIGDMCMIYLYLMRRSRAALGLLVLMFACEFTLGFLSSAKEFAFRGLVLLLIGVLFLKGRVPVRGLLLGLFAALLTFSFFQDMRAQVTRQGRMDLSAIIDKLSSDPTKTFGSDNEFGARFGRGADYFASRGNLKGSVETAVAHSGVDVPYQNGRTLIPIVYAFVPRAWLPEKADTNVGLLFNKEFKISSVRTVYIAAGQNGELYWNFGWPGLVVGMLLMGALMGATSVALDLKRTVTLPRFLLLMLTVYLLAFRFEAGIADQYALWLRSVVLLLLIHAFMPKARQSVST